MQDSFNEFQNCIKDKSLTMRNENLQAILDRIQFLFLPNNINDILTKFLQNESKILIIDEYRGENESKYLFVCFDYKLMILNHEKSLPYLNNFMFQHEYLEIYFLKKNSIF